MDGTIFPTEHSVLPLEDEAGGRVGWVSVVRDISERVQAAQAARRHGEEVAEMELLREMDRLRSELIANVSHELRTPLGLIKIFCTTLLRQDIDVDPGTRLEFLRDIDEETEKLGKIVDNLLNLSRIEGERLRLDRHPTDLGQLVDEIIRSLRVQTTRHRLERDFPDGLVAEVDGRSIEQVLRNLLDNAIKYSPAGGAITVQGRRLGQEIAIRVSDRGIGIPAGEEERIFERFYRVDSEATRFIGGAGLGLAVCRGIVAAHGGRIWVESTPGAGSTFCFSLPSTVPLES